MAETVEFWDYPISTTQLYETYGVTLDEINELNTETFTEGHFFTGGASIKLPASKVKFEPSPTGEADWVKVEVPLESFPPDPIPMELPNDSISYREAGQYQYIATNPSDNTDEFLRQWWVAEGHDPSYYDEAQVEAQFIQYWEREIEKLNDIYRAYVDDDDLPPWLQGEQNMEGYFAPLIEGQGIAVLPEAFLDAYGYLDAKYNNDTFHYGEESPVIIDAKAFMNARARELGQPLPYDPHVNFNENLAIDDFTNLYLDESYLDQGGYIGMILGMLWDANPEILASLQKSSELSHIWETLASYIGNPSGAIQPLSEQLGQLPFESQVELAHSLSGEYHETATEMGLSTAPADYALSHTQAYLDAQALDQLRAVVFDPSWNPEVEAQKLAILAEKIEEMETSILGVDITWVQQSFKAYHKTMSEYEAWRLKMLPLMQEVELQMLERQDEELLSFWWLEIVGSVLFEPIDWLLTARDLLSGDMGALIGFLPLIPASIRNIADAGRYMKGATGDLIRRFMGDSSEWSEVLPHTFLRTRGEFSATRIVGYEEGVRTITSWGDAMVARGLISREDLDELVDLYIYSGSPDRTVATLIEEHPELEAIKTWLEDPTGEFMGVFAPLLKYGKNGEIESVVRVFGASPKLLSDSDNLIHSLMNAGHEISGHGQHYQNVVEVVAERYGLDRLQAEIYAHNMWYWEEGFLSSDNAEIMLRGMGLDDSMINMQDLIILSQRDANRFIGIEKELRELMAEVTPARAIEASVNIPSINWNEDIYTFIGRSKIVLGSDISEFGIDFNRIVPNFFRKSN